MLRVCSLLSTAVLASICASKAVYRVCAPVRVTLHTALLARMLAITVCACQLCGCGLCFTAVWVLRVLDQIVVVVDMLLSVSWQNARAECPLSYNKGMYFEP